MAATVQKWGNSLGIRIPKAMAQQASLEEGTVVEFQASENELVIRSSRKPRRRSRYRLSDLLKGVKAPSPHRKLFSDPPRGRELL